VCAALVRFRGRHTATPTKQFVAYSTDSADADKVASRLKLGIKFSRIGASHETIATANAFSFVVRSGIMILLLCKRLDDTSTHFLPRAAGPMAPSDWLERNAFGESFHMKYTSMTEHLDGY
jgi:hypothetical protein